MHVHEYLTATIFCFGKSIYLAKQKLFAKSEFSDLHSFDFDPFIGFFVECSPALLSGSNIEWFVG